MNIGILKKKMKMWSYWMKWYVYDFLNIVYLEYIGKESIKIIIGRYLNEKSYEWLMLLLKKNLVLEWFFLF